MSGLSLNRLPLPVTSRVTLAGIETGVGAQRQNEAGRAELVAEGAEAADQGLVDHQHTNRTSNHKTNIARPYHAWTCE